MAVVAAMFTPVIVSFVFAVPFFSGAIIQTYMNTLRPQLKFILLYLSYFDKIGR